jgi:agmatine deiminase
MLHKKTRKNSITKNNSTQRLSTPKKDGYYMPSEFEKQSATWLGWPSNPGTFRLKGAQRAIEEVARIISKYQIVHIVAQPSAWEEAYECFKDCANIFVNEVDSNDNWLRDIAPTFLIKPVAVKISGFLSVPIYKKFDFVCEGGSFSVDGQGTLITTEECLLNPNRNKNLTKSQIANNLCNYLNLTKVIWLPYGVFHDTDTNGHVDNMCVFAGVGKVMLTWPNGCGTDECEDKEQEIRSMAALDVLENSTDAKGNKITVYKIPHPTKLYYTKSEVKSLPGVNDGSFARKDGVRMAASHVNLIITNEVVVVPIFHCPTDNEAIKAVSEVFPNKKVVGVYAREILLGGGNIHCMSQQQPYSTDI